MSEFPVVSAYIQGVPARAFMIIRRPIPQGAELMSVKDAVDVDKALSDPENVHCCPLCGDFLTTLAFRAHAQQCIDARAPRRRIWAPPGTRGAIVAYKEKIKPDFADPDSDYYRQHAQGVAPWS